MLVNVLEQLSVDKLRSLEGKWTDPENCEMLLVNEETTSKCVSEPGGHLEEIKNVVL